MRYPKNTLVAIQSRLEKNISDKQFSKYFVEKMPENHLELLNAIVISNIKSGGFASVSKVIKDFIEVCTAKDCSINLSLSLEGCLSFVKHSLRDIDFQIINSYQKKSKHSILQFSVPLDQLDQVQFNLPMITTPNDWVLSNNLNNGVLGGYLHNRFNLVKLINNNHRLDNSETLLSTRMINLINRLQKVKINSESLEKCYNIHKSEYDLNLLTLDKMKMLTKYDKILYYMFRDECIIHKKILLRSYEIFIDVINTHKIKQYYFIYNICFRGRIYASGLISPTSDKVLRSLISPLFNCDKVIEMDASASVLQILSTISCSIKLGEICNIFDKEYDTWSYIHNLIINLSLNDVDCILNEYFISNNNSKVFSGKDIFESINIIDRNIVKYTIMRILYGSNPYQISKDFRSEYSNKHLSYKHILLIYATFFHQFKDEIDVLKVIKLLNKYMIKQNSRGLHINNNFISFTNTYYKVDYKSIKFRDNDNRIREVEVELISNDLDITKSCNASCPNLFHSIDSEICLSIIEEFLNNNKFIFTIHDAFIISECDKEILLSLYNKFLFNQHNKLSNLIESHYKLIKMNDNDDQFVRSYVKSLNERKESYVKRINLISNSKFTLKVNYKEYHCSALKLSGIDLSENKELIKYTLNLKAHVHNPDLLLNIFGDKLINYYPDSFLPGYIQIYSQHIQYIGGARFNVSSKPYRLDQFQECVQEFSGKLEQYGTSNTEYIPIVQSLNFSHLNEESLQLIMKIESEMNETLKSKPKLMSPDLWLKLEHITTKINIDHKSENMGISDKTKKTILDKIKSFSDYLPNNNDVKYNELSKENDSYVRAYTILNNERSKPLHLRNKKLINSKNTLANYYVRKFGFDKRHFSLYSNNNGIKYDKIIDAISIEFNVKINNRNKFIRNKYVDGNKAEEIISRDFINTLLLKNIPDRENIIAADFETIVHRNKHYVFCASMCYKPTKFLSKKNRKDVDAEYEHSRNYINTVELDSKLDNIEDLSDKVLLNFWVNLNYIISKRLKKKDKPIVYFHNMDKFDGVFILKLLSLLLNKGEVELDEVDIIQRNSVMYQIKIGNIIIRDSLHVLQGSLDKLSKTFLNEGKKEIDIKFTYKSIIGKSIEISRYCDHDTYLLYNIMRKFKEHMIELYSIDPTSVMTISSLSFKILRSHYIEDKCIENSTNNKNKHEYILQSYRGGFCGVFIPLEEEYVITHIDINSSYPYSMTMDLPKGLGMWVHNKFIRELNDNIDIINRDGFGLFGFFDVRVKVEAIRNISPLIIKYDGKLTDVSGEIRTTIFSEELKFIMMNGGVLIEIFSGVIYDKAPILDEFANTLYTRRKSSNNNIIQLLIKLILNSSYGRFALKDNHEQVKICSNEQLDELNKYRMTSNEVSMGEKYVLFNLHKTPDDRQIDLNNNNDYYLCKLINSKIRGNALRGIQIASAIAAYSRIRLLKQCFKIQDDGYKVYYMDTDSIYTNMPAKRLIELGDISDKLGDWKIEGENLRGIFVQSKFYLTSRKDSDNAEIKLKSIPKGAIKDLEKDDNVWNLFRDRVNGKAIEIVTDKYFLRNIKDKSIDVRNDIKYRLEDKGNLKRHAVYEDNVWVNTKSYHVKYDTSKKYDKKYSINKDVGDSNIEILRINTDLKELASQTIAYVITSLSNYEGKFPSNVKLTLSSYNLSKYELKIMIAKKCEHSVRIIISLDDMILSSGFISLSDSIDYISEIEERYKYNFMKSITIMNRTRNKVELQNVFVSVIESTLSKIDQSEIIPEDMRIMMQWFMIAIKSDNLIEGFENYYTDVDSLIKHIVKRSMSYLNIDRSYENTSIYNMIRMFIIDQMIKGFDINNDTFK